MVTIDIGHAKYTDAEAVSAVEAETTLEFDAATIISTASGDLTLAPVGGSNLVLQTTAGGFINVNVHDLGNVDNIRGTGASNLKITSRLFGSDAASRRIELDILDTGGNADVVVGYAEPSGTETTPFWAQRGDITTPLIGTLDASFLTFKWNPGDDTVVVYVNDGGTIRSVSIGTVT